MVPTGQGVYPVTPGPSCVDHKATSDSCSVGQLDAGHRLPALGQGNDLRPEADIDTKRSRSLQQVQIGFHRIDVPASRFIEKSFTRGTLMRPALEVEWGRTRREHRKQTL